MKNPTSKEKDKSCFSCESYIEGSDCDEDKIFHAGKLK